MSIKDWIKKRRERVYPQSEAKEKVEEKGKAEAKADDKPAEKGDMKENVMPGVTPPPAEPEPDPVLDERDYRRLANNHYEEVKGKFKTVFVIQHVKTKKIAELKAASAVHAANMLGWRPRQVRVINTYEL